MRRLLPYIWPALLLASGVVTYLSLRAPVSRPDRLVVLLFLCFVYTSILVALRAIVLGARAVWFHIRRTPTSALAPKTRWGLPIALGLLAISRPWFSATATL